MLWRLLSREQQRRLSPPSTEAALQGLAAGFRSHSEREENVEEPVHVASSSRSSGEGDETRRDETRRDEHTTTDTDRLITEEHAAPATPTVEARSDPTRNADLQASARWLEEVPSVTLYIFCIAQATFS